MCVTVILLSYAGKKSQLLTAVRNGGYQFLKPNRVLSAADCDFGSPFSAADKTLFPMARTLNKMLSYSFGAYIHLSKIEVRLLDVLLGQGEAILGKIEEIQ